MTAWTWGRMEQSSPSKDDMPLQRPWDLFLVYARDAARRLGYEPLWWVREGANGMGEALYCQTHSGLFNVVVIAIDKPGVYRRSLDGVRAPTFEPVHGPREVVYLVVDGCGALVESVKGHGRFTMQTAREYCGWQATYTQSARFPE